MTYRITPLLLLLVTAACQPARSPDAIARDRDGDGIANASDACPDKSESKNEHNDHDGCPDHLRAKRGLWVPGAVVLGLSVPLVAVGAKLTADGVASQENSIDPFMSAGSEYYGIPFLVAAGIHQAVGISLIVAGAVDREWTDGPNDEGPPASPVRFELGKRGVGIRY